MTHASADGRYERTDARARPLFLWGFVLATLLSVSLAVSFWITQAMTEDARSAQRPNPIDDLRQPPEGPVLQSVPTSELLQHRAWEDRMLTGTEWIDPVSRIVRIPIERAMELCLAEGFAVRTEEQK